jgi:lysophospholipase L1-like esterase
LKRRLRFWVIIVLISVCVFLVASRIVLVRWYLPWYQNASADPEFFASDIEKFATLDRDSPPPAHPILFVGSSSIRLWDTLQRDMAPLPVLNRGFGGARLSSVVHFVDRAVIRYQPRAIVLYAGDNDINGGESVERVVRDFEAFVSRVQLALPDTRIYYLSMKPSLLHWAFWPEYEQANARIASICANDPRLGYIDGATPLLAKGHPPPRELYKFDQEHLSAKGYALWTEVIRSRLCKDLDESARSGAGPTTCSGPSHDGG